jgi:exodeoxyribonuclease-5
LHPNDDQQAALDAVVNWFRGGGTEFVLAGLAGTGKTAMLPWLNVILKCDVRYLCPTWKAADVLTRRLGGSDRATSVHNLIYRPLRDQHSKECGWWSDAKTCDRNCTMEFQYACKSSCDPDGHPGLAHDSSCFDAVPDLIVVDEASMVDEQMHEDLRRVGSPVLYVGDHGQLPPVSGNYSVFGRDGGRADARLERIMRQGPGSGIIRASRAVRRGGLSGLDGVADSEEVRVFQTGQPGYQMDDWHADGRAIFITPTNKKRAHLNSVVRSAWGRKPGVPVIGDRLMVLDNLHHDRVYNGQTGTVTAVEMLPADRKNRMVGCQAEIQMESGRTWAGLVDVPNLDAEADMRAEPRASGRTLTPTVRWRWAYAVTCHKAQGSEWERAVVDTKAYMQDPRRWLYTAVTRAKSDLVVLR